MRLNSFTKVWDLLDNNNGVVVCGDWKLEGKTPSTDNNRWYSLSLNDVEIFNNSSANDSTTQALMRLKIVEAFNTVFNMKYTESSQNPFFGIFDFIYNFHHLRITSERTGKVLRDTISECETRYNHDSYYPFTDWLYNKLVNSGMNQDEFAFLAHRFRAFKHGTEDKYFYTRNCISARIDGDSQEVPAHLDLSKWGYKQVTFPRWDRPTDTVTSWVSENEQFLVIDGHSYPRKYANRYFKICSCCGNRAPRLFAGQCAVCLKVDPEKVQIRNYQDRAPSFLKFKEGKYSKALFKEPLYLGVELELESDGRRGSDGLDKSLLFAARTLGDHCIFKRDGSINNGFEIVSTAATLDVHRAEWKAFFDGVESESYLGKRDNVGMHVHVSREPLNFLTQGKMSEFMNRADNKKYLKEIAGRWSEHYAKQEPGRTVTYPFLSSDGSERYNAFNLRNKATVEFRIFAATTDYNEFVMRLEFCEALAYYCSPCQSDAPSLKDVTKWEWFAKYVNKNNQQWPLLAKFIKGL